MKPMMDITSSGRYSHEIVTMRLLAKLREIARQRRGVRSIVVMYAEGAGDKIPVRVRH